MDMRLVLKEDVEKLGSTGDIVKVANGYGRNYLLPRGLAVLATPVNLKQLEIRKSRLAKIEAKDKESSELLAAQITKLALEFSRKVGETEQMYGSVTNHDIAEELARRGFDIDKRKIEIEEPIKVLGVHDVPIKLHQEVLAHLKVWVVKED